MRLNVNIDPLWDAAERMLPPGDVRGRLRILIDRKRLCRYETDGLILVFTDDPSQADGLAGEIRDNGLADRVTVAGCTVTVYPKEVGHES